MHLFRNCAVLLSLSTALTITAHSQNAAPASGTPAATNNGSGPVDLSGFKDQIEQKNKALTDKVKAEEQIVRKNGAIIEDAKKIDAENKKLEAARKLLEAQNAEFEREREAIQAEQNGVSTSASQAQPQQPQRQPQIQPQRQATPAPAAAPSRPAPAPTTPAVVAAARTAPPAPAARPAAAPAPAAPLISDAIDASAVDPALRTATYVPGPVATPTPNDGVIVVTAKDEGPLRVSAGVLQGMLLAPIRPVYPQMARTAHVEGSVVLDAVISKKGTVENVHAVSGPMILREAAIEAIQSARYQPYRLNEEPIEVETTITIAFEQTH
jgi:protein TonB